MRFSSACILVAAVAGCSGSTRKAGSCDGPCPSSKIDHLIVIVQENHTFDSYFGQYCTAPTGSAPTCTDGPGCCEAGPTTDPSGASPMVLDDSENASFDPDHTQACELSEIDGGKMDHFATGASCSDPRHFAYIDPSLVQPYTQLAQNGALADRYFQPLVGQSSSNDMYLVSARFVFKDNDYEPDAIGHECSITPQTMEFPGPIIGDLLDGAGVSWSFYAEGYADMVAARKAGNCGMAPDACNFGVSLYPCVFDPGDVPIDYYANFRDNARVLADYTQFAKDLSSGTLPQVAWVRGLGYHSEHPGERTTISDGTTFVQQVIKAVQASDYAPDTLVLVTWDEGGGFFDHVAPPPAGSDGQPYGTRVPLLAVGPFAHQNAVSHATLEHSSIVKFIEWNWLSMQVGQLNGRDATVANLGSLLDPTRTGTMVPE
jgi:phospholipase C